jgi:hypothetical protein
MYFKGEVLREDARLARRDRPVKAVVVRTEGPELEAAEAATRVGLPAALGVLAVVDDVDAVLVLEADDLFLGFLDPLLEGGIEGLAVFPPGHGVAQVVRPMEAARVTRQDPVCASFHLASSQAEVGRAALFKL